MDKLARRVAARYGLKVALGDWQPPMPVWVIPWSDRMLRQALVVEPTMRLNPHRKQKVYKPEDFEPKYKTFPVYNPKIHEFTPPEVHPGQDLFDEAKLSVEILLPKVLATLKQKFGERFYMHATQQRMKLYYYFSADPAMETISLMMSVHGNAVTLGLGYVPTKLLGGADFSRALQETVLVREPAVAGLALMRLLRKLLSRVCSSGSCLN